MKPHRLVVSFCNLLFPFYFFSILSAFSSTTLVTGVKTDLRNQKYLKETCIVADCLTSANSLFYNAYLKFKSIYS